VGGLAVGAGLKLAGNLGKRDDDKTPGDGPRTP
jgi:hypothetical protein